MARFSPDTGAIRPSGRDYNRSTDEHGQPGTVRRLQELRIRGEPGTHWWRLITSTFVYRNTGYAFIARGAIAVFGWLLERRHGPLPVLALYAVGAVGGTAAAAAIYSVPVALGANGAALALVVA